MKKLMKIKRILMVALQSAALGTALLGSAAYAADAATPAPVLASTTAKDLILKGDATCTGCHDEADDTGVDTKSMLALHPSVLAIAKTKHGVRGDSRTPTCTNCHGESLKHINKAPGLKDRPGPDRTYGKKSVTPVAERNEACLTCHKKDTKRHQWDGSAHQVNDVACTNCHQVHTGHDKVRDKKTQPEVCYACHKEQRADSKKISHHPLGEGKVTCSDCHNAHGSTGPKLLKKNTLNETCFTCHAEKRGPFLWEHQPAAEDCSNCHTPHGSNLSPLLKARPNFLCQDCHDGAHQSSSPVGPVAGGFQGGLTVQNSANTTNAQPSVGQVGKACMNCHTMVHGSNSPTGAWLHR